MKLPAPGSCQCGEVRYSLTAEPLMTYACYCQNCQKRTGSAFSMGLIVSAATLQVEGRLSSWERQSDQGVTNVRFSCAACGNVIYGHGLDQPELLKLQAGTLEDAREVVPEVHLWTCRAQRWLELPPEAPRYERQPGDPMEMLQRAVQYRQQLAGDSSPAA